MTDLDKRPHLQDRTKVVKGQYVDIPMMRGNANRSQD